MSRYELHAPAVDPEVPGRLMAFCASLNGAAKWCHDTVGATATDRKTGKTLDSTVLPKPPDWTMKESESC